MKKTSQFRSMLESKQLEYILEAHNGLSAKIVEEAGFKGIWGSGLSLSAAMGVRDNNEASWTQVLDVIEFMTDVTDVPLLLDGDTGYGNFNNFRRLVKKLEQKDVAAVCIEDKLFPKTNSFISGETQPLADIVEFSNKIKAGKDTQIDSDFSIVARVEAFIAGWGVEEALRRAEAYSEAGADAVLIHSKISDSSDIDNFMKHWKKDTPVVIVPTTYSSVPSSHFEDIGVSLVIWANHILRSSITAMRSSAKEIYDGKSVQSVSNRVASVANIFELQDAAELKAAEKIYLPDNSLVKAIVLAASKGDNFGSLTDDKPKCMLEVKGKPVLTSVVETLNAEGIKNIDTVVGYKHEAVGIPGINKIVNNDFSTSGALNSLYSAKESLNGCTILSYGDILYDKWILRELLDSKEDITLVVNTSKENYNEKDQSHNIIAEKSYNSFHSKTTGITGFGGLSDEFQGCWVGLLKCSSRGSEILKTELEEFKAESPEEFLKSDITALFKRILRKGTLITGLYVNGYCLDINDIEDISKAYN